MLQRSWLEMRDYVIIQRKPIFEVQRMSLFNKNKEMKGPEPTDLPVNPAARPILMERPRICALDLSAEGLEVLAGQGYKVFEGSLGATVKVPNKGGANSI
jgi:hypothetical protein